jgi:hypothetical protein
MSEIKNLLSSEIGKISSPQKEFADSQMIEIESILTDDYKFRKRGNVEQFKHNRQVLSKLKEAETQLKPESIALEISFLIWLCKSASIILTCPANRWLENDSNTP